jgi:hypothetical protein
MIKRSALPKGIVTELLGDTKLVRTLAGCLKSQEVATMRDFRLPKFDKNRRINQQRVLVFDNDNVKYNIILGTNFLSKSGIKYGMVDCPIPLCSPGGLNSTEYNSMEEMFHYKSKTSSLVKIATNALQLIWTMRKQMQLMSLTYLLI